MIRVRRDPASRLPARLDAVPPAVTAIRAVRPADADALLDLRVRNREFLAPWDPLRPASFFTRAGQAEWIALQQRAWTEDRGYGFPIEDQDKVWEKFYRVSRDGRVKEEESTGLGLSFVRQVVEQHGGQVFLESEVGRGSRVGFTLPRL